MKRIIGNRVYDTGTASQVAEWSNMDDVSSFDYVSETLYRKRNGEYFLHGEGGLRSRYAQSMGQNTWGAGEAIMPLGYDAARNWMEAHAGADDYEREFGVVEDDSETVLSVRVSVAAKARLDAMAARTGRTRGDIVTELLMRGDAE